MTGGGPRAHCPRTLGRRHAPSASSNAMSDQTPNEPVAPVESFEERQARLLKMERENEAAEKELAAQEAALLSVEGQLSQRQAAFVREYLVDFNGTQACIRSGYSDPATTAHRLLKLPRITKAIEAGRLARESRVGMTRERVLSEMAILAESRLEHYIIDDEGQLRAAPGAPEGAMGAVQSLKRRVTVKTDKEGNTYKTYDVEFKLWDKPTPLRLMGKHVGLSFDRVEVTGPNGGPIVSRVLREVVDPVTEGDA